MHPSTTRAGTGGSSGAYNTRGAPPVYIPPDRPLADFPERLEKSAFTHYPLEGVLPYRPHSREHVSMLAHLALTITDDDWPRVPALGELLCRSVKLHDVIDLIDIITCEGGPPYLPVESAFRIPPSLFVEIPVLMAISDYTSDERVNVLMHFQGARALIRYFSALQADHELDETEIPEVIAVGARVITAGSLSESQPRDEVYLPADSNRVIWTPFWEWFGDYNPYTHVLEIAHWNAHVYDMMAIESGVNPQAAPNSWRLWPSVHADLGPPRWLTEHRLRARVPLDVESGRYAHKLSALSCPYHGDFVVWEYYLTPPPFCTCKGRVHSRRRRRRAPMAPPAAPPPDRAIGCQLPEWVVTLDPDKPPPSAVSLLDLPFCTPPLDAAAPPLEAAAPPLAATHRTFPTDVTPCMRPTMDRSEMIVYTSLSLIAVLLALLSRLIAKLYSRVTLTADMHKRLKHEGQKMPVTFKRTRTKKIGHRRAAR